MRIKKRTIILNGILVLLIAAGLFELTQRSFDLDRLTRILIDDAPIKLTTFLLIDILVAEVSSFAIKNKSMIFKYSFFAVTAILLAAGALLVNAWWHFIGFLTMFGPAADVKYWNFVISDISHAGGRGCIRYIIVFICYIVIAAVAYSKWFKKLWQRVADICSVGSLSEFFGIEVYEEPDEK